MPGMIAITLECIFLVEYARNLHSHLGTEQVNWLVIDVNLIHTNLLLVSPADDHLAIPSTRLLRRQNVWLEAVNSFRFAERINAGFGLGVGVVIKRHLVNAIEDRTNGGTIIQKR